MSGLVLTRDEGRRCVNSLNAVPIRLIYERWVSRFAEHWATTSIGLKEALEKETPEDSKEEPPKEELACH